MEFIPRSIMALTTLFAAMPLSADVHLPSVFGDHMVLQRQMAVSIWGTADAGEKVTVAFAGQSKSIDTDASGKWSLKLDAMEASAEPRELVVSGKSTVKFTDVLVGEVWLAGGQSNMGYSLGSAHNAAEVLPQSTDPQLRLFKVKLTTAAEPQTNVSAQWKSSNPDTAKDFSAVAWFFAHELRGKLNCPVGVMAAPWGGTPIETWISLDRVKQDPPLTRTLESWNKALEQHQKVLANPQLATDYAAELAKWKKEVEPAFNIANRAWIADKNAGKSVGPKPQPERPEPSNPDPFGMPSPSRRPSAPSVSFNGMVAPLAPYAIRGAIWYQGEANGSAGIEYRSLLPRLIEDWRAHWNSDFAFLYVQLPCNGADTALVATSGWPWLREAQLLTLKQPKTSMAVTIDIGNPADVHPADKVDVGHRLALLARRDVYGEKIVASGPLYEGFAIEGSAIRVRFKEIGGGLAPGQAPWMPKGVEPLPTDRLIGFFIAGDDRKWVEADAKIDGASVIVSSPSVPHPVAVRYGWANSPRCNLYNLERLPASPFRTDQW